MYLTLLIFHLVSLFAHYSIADKTEKVGEVTTNAMSTSGELAFSKGKHQIKFKIEECSEKDKDGNDVGSNRPKNAKHRLVGFSTQHFNPSNAQDTTYKNIAAKIFNISTIIKGPNATLDIQIIMFKANGSFSIGNGAEDYNVTAGTIKLNVIIKDWIFCGNVAGDDAKCLKSNKVQEGKYVDVGLSVHGKRNAKPARKTKKIGDKGRKERFAIDGGEFIVSGKVKVDGTWKDMAAGFPKLVSRGPNKQIFIFRFEKFSRQSFYDPVIEFSGDGDSLAGKAGAIVTHFSMMFIPLIVLFSKLFN